MNTIDLVTEKMQSLSPEKQAEVLDFVEFLAGKYQPKHDNRSAEQRAIDRLPDVEDWDNPDKWHTVVEIDEEIDEKAKQRK